MGSYYRFPGCSSRNCISQTHMGTEAEEHNTGGSLESHTAGSGAGKGRCGLTVFEKPWEERVRGCLLRNLMPDGK